MNNKEKFPSSEEKTLKGKGEVLPPKERTLSEEDIEVLAKEYEIASKEIQQLQEYGLDPEEIEVILEQRSALEEREDGKIVDVASWSSLLEVFEVVDRDQSLMKRVVEEGVRSNFRYRVDHGNFTATLYELAYLIDQYKRAGMTTGGAVNQVLEDIA